MLFESKSWKIRKQLGYYLLVWGMTLASFGICWAQQPSAQEDLQLELGLNGTWKLGQVCPVRLRLSDEILEQTSQIELQTVDGDGVELNYRKQLGAALKPNALKPNALKPNALKPNALKPGEDIWIPIRIGRQGNPLQVRAVRADGSIAAEREIGAEELGDGLASDQPLILALGSSMGVEQLMRVSSVGGESNFSTAVVTSPEQLPSNWIDYSGCDLILFSCQDHEFFKRLSSDQWHAIDIWIRRGGGCIISLGTSSQDPNTASEASSIEMLAQWLPGPILGVGQVNDPAALETLVATDEPINGFPVCLVDNVKGKVELSFTDSLSRPVPWWISYPHGHGTIRFIASDLGHATFNGWKDRQLLWEKLLEPYLDRTMLEGISTDKQTTDSSYLGYSDLVGQLRATLDVFSSVRVVSFGQVAFILIGILLLIGPLDYLVSVKWLKRPNISWYFSGSMLLAASIGLTWFYGSLRPDEVQINTAQIVDIDAATGDINGRLWSHVYSGNAHRVDIEAVSSVDQPVFLDWQGLPGRGLGGLLSQLTIDRGMPLYSIEIEPTGISRFRSVGISAAGTKCVVGNWVGKMEIANPSQLREIPGVDQLTGELTNPLDVDLKDAVLFYHNWYYPLASRIPAGSSVSISYDTIPKDLARRLNQRKLVEGKDAITRWDPADRGAIDRLLELMMFHEAAAGRSYTSLTHRYQPQIDHSNLLETDLAILVGRIDIPQVSVRVSSSDASKEVVRQAVDRAWCRISMPVEKQVGR